MKKYWFIYVLFFITLVISLFIMFYDPYKDSLKVYKDTMTIELFIEEDGYNWEYEMDNNILNVNEKGDSWIFSPLKDGTTTLTFYFKNSEDVKYTIEYVLNVKGNKIIWTSGKAKGLLDYPNPY